MAVSTNNSYDNLLISVNALAEGVCRGEDSTSLEQKQRGIIMLIETVRQMSNMDMERTISVKALEQLDIKNTLGTVGQLLALQLQLQVLSVI